MEKTPNPDPAPELPTLPYKVLCPLQHDLVAYAPDSQVELTEAQAAPLLAVRAIEAAPDAATA